MRTVYVGNRNEDRGQVEFAKKVLICNDSLFIAYLIYFLWKDCWFTFWHNKYLIANNLDIRLLNIRINAECLVYLETDSLTKNAINYCLHEVV